MERMETTRVVLHGGYYDGRELDVPYVGQYVVTPDGRYRFSSFEGNTAGEEILHYDYAPSATGEAHDG